MCPLGKGVRGIKTSGSGYLRLQIREGRKGRAERLGLGQRPHNIAKKSDRSAARASSDAGPKLAGRESDAAMESPKALIAPLKRGLGGLRQAGPGICGSKYVEDEKAARSVRVWDRVPIKKRESPDERLKTLPKNGGFLLSHLVWQYHRR